MSGSPWWTTSRPAISVSQVSPTTIDGAKTDRRTIPTRQTRRIGNGLVSRIAPEASFGAGFRPRSEAVGTRAGEVIGVGPKSDTGLAQPA